MNPIERVLGRLGRVRRAGGGWAARCPAHRDRTPSLSVAEGAEGRVLLKCHAGCTAEQIVGAIGLDMADLFDRDRDNDHRFSPKAQAMHRPSQTLVASRRFSSAAQAVTHLQNQLGTPAATWNYTDASGNDVMQVVRFDTEDGKTYRPIYQQDDSWVIGAMPEPRVLYRLPEVIDASRVLVVEGEKAADAARRLGFCATTSSGGAQAATKTDWAPLIGKEVWILPDHDAPGRQYADTVESILRAQSSAAVIVRVVLPGLPEGGDIVDWIAGEGERPNLMLLKMRLGVLATVKRFKKNEAPAIGPKMEPYDPFPIAALPPLLGDFVSIASKAIGCDPSYIALPSLVMLAGSIGMTRQLELKRGWMVPPILWGVVVGESGSAKTPAFRLATKPLDTLQRHAIGTFQDAWESYEIALEHYEQQGKQSKSGDVQAVADKPPKPRCTRWLVSDTTIEALASLLQANPRGLILARDELNGWFGSFTKYSKGDGSAEASNWLSLYNGTPLLVDRKTGDSRVISVPRAAVWVVGGIQPAILKKSLSEEHRESGLAARLLLCYPPGRPKVWTEDDIDPNWIEWLTALVSTLLQLQFDDSNGGEPEPVTVGLTPGAKELWIDYFGLHAQEQAELTGELAAAWAKLEEYAARLALVIHLIRAVTEESVDPDRVDAISMQAGITLANWFKQEARRVYAMLGESREEQAQRRLLDWIARKGGQVTVRKIQQSCRWLKGPGEAEKALDSLAERGYGVWETQASPHDSTRQSRTFILKRPTKAPEPEMADPEGNAPA